METFTLKVIGFSRVFYEGEAVQAQLPIQDGSMGIMAHHEAAVIGIVPGTMRLQTPDGEWQSAVVDAGFARVGENTVSVMVEEVLRPEGLKLLSASMNSSRSACLILQKHFRRRLEANGNSSNTYHTVYMAAGDI